MLNSLLAALFPMFCWTTGGLENGSGFVSMSLDRRHFGGDYTHRNIILKRRACYAAGLQTTVAVTRLHFSPKSY